MKKLQILLVALLFPFLLSGQGGISAGDLGRHIGFLASDSLKGRKPGTAEMDVAARYIRDQFVSSGLSLPGDNGFQWFEIVTGVELGDANTLDGKGNSFQVRKDFIPLAFSSSISLQAGLMFAGFGIEAEADSLSWSDYRNIDVKGKWVMILRGDPEPEVSDSRFIPFGDIRSKILTAKDKGAGGILLVTPASMEKEDKLIPLAAENNDVTTGIPVINITRETAGLLLAGTGNNIDSLERFIVSSRRPFSFDCGTMVNAKVDVRLNRKSTANVMGLLKGNDPELKDQIIVVGAHYDHLGMGGPGSGSRLPDTVAVHNGADDNASGTAMVIELARFLAKEKGQTRRTILFVAFSGEEMGLLGSKYFVNHPPVDIKQVVAMFNFDMVGRFDRDKNSISISGTGTSAEADSILKSLEKELPFSVVHAPDGYGPSDHAAFYAAGIPVFYFNTGVHTDYHTPFDDTDKIDVAGEKLVGDFAASVILGVDRMNKALSFRESGIKESSGRGGRKLKVTLGIMPDFAGTEKSGLRIDGVTKDGPADKGGMKKGDIIVAMNGMKVGNIYEYMSRLQKLKHGMTVNVEVIRGEKREILIIQL